jgi:hypothetical protein
MAHQPHRYSIRHEPDGDYVCWEQLWWSFNGETKDPVWFVCTRWLIPGTELED